MSGVDAMDRASQPPRVFLSHSGEDTDLARKFALQLRHAGVDVWLDVESLKPGEPWMPQIEHALDRAQAFLVYVGDNGVTNWVDREVRVALERATADARFPLIPILGPGSVPESLPPFLRQHQWVDVRDDRQRDSELDKLTRALVCGEPTTAPLLPDDIAPFKGLLAFDVDDALLFYGRERETEELLSRLASDSFLAVVGDSGCGKSSLIRAGLVPALHRGRFHDGRSWVGAWRVAIARPGSQPLRELNEALVDLQPNLSAAEKLDFLNRFSEPDAITANGLRNAIASLVPSGAHTLLVIDQFEELFTLTHDIEERNAFVELLLGAVDTEGSRPVHVLIALRADFYSCCWEYEPLVRRIDKNQYLVSRIDNRRLEDVIQKPLALMGGSCEAGLIDTILDELGDEPGALPVLEHALSLLWESRKGRVLTHESYNQIGRLSGALKNHADRVLSGLDGTVDERIVRKVFLQLTQLGEGRQDTRRRARKTDLLELGEDPAIVGRVLERLRTARLITMTADESRDTQQGSDVVEVAHEALIREWPTLRQWVDDDRESIRIERRLSRAVDEWDQLGRESSALLRGARLLEAEAWANDHAKDAPPRMKAFLDASTALRRRHARLKAAFMWGLMVVLTVVSGLAWIAKRAESESRSRELASDALLTLERAPHEALDLAMRAVLESRTREAEEALRKVVATPKSQLTFAHRSRRAQGAVFIDGTRLATPAGNETIAVIDVDNGSCSQPLEREVELEFELFDVSKSSSGRIVAAVSTRDVTIWPLTDAETFGRPKTWHQPFDVELGGTQIVDVAVSPQGDAVAVVDLDGTLTILSADGTLVHRETNAHEKGIFGVAYSHDGSHLATAGQDRFARLWQIDDSRLVRTDCCRRYADVMDVAFHPTEHTLATAGRDGTVTLIDAESQLVRSLFPAHPDVIYDVEFDPNGACLATAGGDGVARIWSLDHDDGPPRLAAELKGHESKLQGVVFGPERSKVATVGEDGTTRVWDLRGDSMASICEHRGDIVDVAFSPTGMLASASVDGTVRLSTRGARDARPIVVRADDAVSAIAFGPNGDELAVAALDGVKFWNLDENEWDGCTLETWGVYEVGFFVDDTIITSSEDRTLTVWNRQSCADELTWDEARVWSTAASTVTGRIAAGDEDGRIYLSQPSNFTDLRLFASAEQGHSDAVLELAFSSDGSLLASASRDSTIKVWDVASQTVIRTLEGHRLGVTGVSFLRVTDGQPGVASASADGTVKVWELSSSRELFTLRAHHGKVNAVALSPDGKTLASSGEDRTIRLFPVGFEAVLASAPPADANCRPPDAN